MSPVPRVVAWMTTMALLSSADAWASIPVAVKTRPLSSSLSQMNLNGGSASSMPSHFSKLGVTPHMTELKVKKAFRGLALEAHPDKEQDPEAKIRQAETNQLSHKMPPDSTQRPSSSPRSNAKSRSTDSLTKKGPQELCSQIGRQQHERVRDHFESALEVALKVWPDEQACWDAVDKLCPFEIKNLADRVKKNHPEMSEYLHRRLNRKQSYIDQIRNQKIRKCAAFIDSNWPNQQDRMKKMLRKEALVFEYEDIAGLVVSIDAATAIRKWEVQLRESIKKKCEDDIRRSVSEIIDVFPDERAIVRILEKHLSWDRRHIVEQLPEHIRLLISLP